MKFDLKHQLATTQPTFIQAPSKGPSHGRRLIAQPCRPLQEGDTHYLLFYSG